MTGMNSRRRLLLGCQHLPGHQVGVVLHLGQDEQIARLQVCPPPGVRHQVDRLGGIAGEDYLPGGGGVDKFRHPLARALVGGSALFRQGMDAAVDVGIGLAVEVVHRLDDRQRLLAGGGRIQISQRHAGSQLSRQDGEICPDLGNVQGCVG